MSAKVVHLSTSSEGGAGLAARRLNFALNASNFDSSYLSLTSKKYFPNKNEFELSRSFSVKLTGFLFSKFQKRLSSKVFFSPLSKSAIDISKFILKYPPQNTVLHIHNWFNLLSLKTISTLHSYGYKLVFTLHDERLFTGGCHYALNCLQFKQNCSSCPNVNTQYVHLIKKSFSDLSICLSKITSNYVVIAPSKWIFDRARSSTILSTSNLVHIPNSLGNFGNEIHIGDRSTSEYRLVLGVASYEPSSYLKYGDFIEKLMKDDEINKNFEIVFLKNYRDTKIFWRKIDFLIVFSRADNSPNVVHEAKRIGVPIIASNVGGIAELLTPEYDIVIDMDDISTIKIIDLKPEMFKRLKDKRTQTIARARFDTYVYNSVIDHIKVYNNLLKGLGTIPGPK